MKVKVSDLQEGCILIKDVKGNTSHPIISATTVLTKRHLEILHIFLIKEVEIHNKMVDGTYLQGMELTKKQEAIDAGQAESVSAASNDSFETIYSQAVEKFKKEFKSWQSGVGVNIMNIRALLIPLFEIANKTNNWMKDIHLYSRKEDYFYHHSIAVSMIASYIAKGLGYDKGQCLQVALSGCLADCGMAKIPINILNKVDRLTIEELNEVKKHPIYSYQMIKNITLLKPESKLAIAQHHERLDGKGYPSSVKGNMVHTQSQILAIADVYHAMTSERMYKAIQSPFKTLQTIVEDHFGQFDISILKLLISTIASLPVGTLVKLSNGNVGEIVFIKQESLLRPLVKMTDNSEMIDLEKNRHLYIEEVIYNT